MPPFHRCSSFQITLIKAGFNVQTFTRTTGFIIHRNLSMECNLCVLFVILSTYKFLYFHLRMIDNIFKDTKLEVLIMWLYSALSVLQLENSATHVYIQFSHNIITRWQSMWQYFCTVVPAICKFEVLLTAHIWILSMKRVFFYQAVYRKLRCNWFFMFR